MKGQISVEMLIILAIVVAIALLVASQMISMAQETSDKTDDTHKKILDDLDTTVEEVTTFVIYAPA
ncbi:class III signal peptide-containing protein [Candidatus Micrarchaeota archaeon]|nr:class III signal peptide-containing protein [Candidatus Micrarchaeota archaeon]